MTQLLVDLPSHARVIQTEQTQLYPTEYELRAFCESKNRQRDRVVSHILKYHPRNERMRFFGLPGFRWATERILADEFLQNFRGIGVEQAWGVLLKSLPWMPGEKPIQFYQEIMRHGQIECVKTMHGCRLLHFDLHHFVRIGNDHKRPGRHCREYAKRYKRWTCAWYDGWSPLGGQLLRALEYTCSHFSHASRVIPFGVTLLMGRDVDASCYAGLPDSMSALDKRAAVVRRALECRGTRIFEIDDAWTYRLSENGAQMGVILGRAVLR